MPLLLLPAESRINRRTHTMAKPNYQFEKRKRDLAKKAKKEAKRLRKLDRSASSETPGVVEPAAQVSAPTQI